MRGQEQQRLMMMREKAENFLWLYLFSNLTTIKYELLKVNSHLLCSHLIGQLVNDQTRPDPKSAHYIFTEKVAWIRLLARDLVSISIPYKKSEAISQQHETTSLKYLPLSPRPAPK